jgi:SH3 domain-containing YSC84-like protein 1
MASRIGRASAPETEETSMIRILLAAAALAVLPMLAPHPAQAQGEAQTLVDRATLALQDMMNQSVSEDPRVMLQRSRAVMICPRVFKAGFIFGGEGGACALLARAGNGTWSYPAFYGMGSGSVGFQIGIQDSQFVMMIMTDRGLNAVLDSQFKIGADASIAVATIGGGVQGSTTVALGADIIAFSQTRGLYGGVSIEGSVLGANRDLNIAYYNRDYGTRQIVMDMQAANPGADPLRAVLTRYGTSEPQQASIPPPAYQSPPSQAPAYQASPPPPSSGSPTQLAPVQQQNLPPPR